MDLSRFGRKASAIGIGIGVGLAAAWIVFFVGLPFAALIWRTPLPALPAHWNTDAAASAILLTLKTSLVTVLISITLGTPLAYMLARFAFPGRALLRALTEVPLVFPPIVGGVALLVAYGRFGLAGRFLDAHGISIGFTTVAVVLAQTFVAAPFYVRSARTGFQSVDPTFEEVARTLGAAPLRVFFRITLPLSTRSIVAGVALCWARAVGEFGATYMFAGNFQGSTQTMPLAILTTLESDLDGAVALSLLLALVCVAAFALAEYAMERRR